MNIAISAGHHPAKPGARYRDPRTGESLFIEHSEAVIWAKELLHELGIRAEEHELDLHPRIIHPSGLFNKVSEVNRIPGGCALAIELHFNSATNAHGEHIGRGSETLYCPGSSRGEAYARAIQKELAKVFPPDRGTKEGWYRMDRPLQVDYVGDVDGDEVPDYWLKHTNCPAVIVEPEFVQNYRIIKHYRKQGVQAIAAGVINALEAHS